MPDISEKNFETYIERLREYRAALTSSPCLVLSNGEGTTSGVPSVVTGKVDVSEGKILYYHLPVTN